MLTIVAVFLNVVLELLLGESPVDIDVEVVAAFLPRAHVSVVHRREKGSLVTDLEVAARSGNGE